MFDWKTDDPIFQRAVDDLIARGLLEGHLTFEEVGALEEIRRVEPDEWDLLLLHFVRRGVEIGG